MCDVRTVQGRPIKLTASWVEMTFPVATVTKKELLTVWGNNWGEPERAPHR